MVGAGVPIAAFLFCIALFSQSNKPISRDTSKTSAGSLRIADGANPSVFTMQNGPGEQDYNRAARLFEKGLYSEAAAAYKLACDKLDAKACTDLGVMYRRGQGIRKNYPRAAELALRGCKGGNALGCGNLGFMYWNNFMPKDDKRAAELFQQGCDGGDQNSCRALGFMYENGLGVTKDLNRAALFYQKAREHRIPFNIKDGLILVETIFNGVLVKLIVDTGGTTAFGKSFLPPTQALDSPTRTLESVHGSSQVYPVTVVWSFDGRNTQLAAVAGDLSLPNDSDGILGADILETFKSVRFDFLSSVLILEDQ
jgi:Sel1 repeat